MNRDDRKFKIYKNDVVIVTLRQRNGERDLECEIYIVQYITHISKQYFWDTPELAVHDFTQSCQQDNNE